MDLRKGKEAARSLGPDDCIRFEVGGPPVAKGRPRMTRNGFVYSPAKTRKYEAHARLAAQEAMDERAPIDGPVKVEVFAWLPIPKSWSKKKRGKAELGYVAATKRPDCDNYCKAALDALNGVVFYDDSQVIELLVRKGYSVKPRLFISVAPLALEAA